jgi:cytochrome c biogenesis protein ResB
MSLFKEITRGFYSLKTALWLLILLLLLFIAGAVFMPLNTEYTFMSSMPLFQWLRGQPIRIAWWIWGSIGILSLLAINTILCSVESLARKGRARGWLLLIAPQIIHIGFLLVLFAHLLDAAQGFKYLSVVRPGTILQIDDDSLLRIRDIDINIDASGYIRDWRVSVEYISDSRTTGDDVLRPNRPLVRDGLNVSVKDLRAFPHKAVLLQISREPGALWALGGGVLIMAGIIILILFKIRIEK